MTAGSRGTCIVCDGPDRDAINAAIVGTSTFSEIAERYRISRHSVGTHAREHLNVSRGHGWTSASRCAVCRDTRRPEIESAIRGGEKYSLAARRFGLSPHAVSNHARKHLGMDPRGVGKKVGCGVCQHPLGSEADLAILTGVPSAHVGRMLGVSGALVRIHRMRCLGIERGFVAPGGTRCEVCHHPERHAIDEALSTGETCPQVASRFGTGPVYQHRANHLFNEEWARQAAVRAAARLEAVRRYVESAAQ